MTDFLVRSSPPSFEKVPHGLRCDAFDLMRRSFTFCVLRFHCSYVDAAMSAGVVHFQFRTLDRGSSRISSFSTSADHCR